MGNVFENSGKSAIIALKNMIVKVRFFQGRALELTSDSSTAAATENPKTKAATALSVEEFVFQQFQLYSGN